MLTSVKHALRVLRKDPVFTAVAIGSLAIGIGATSAMFSLADAMLLRPLPVLQPDRVVALNTSRRSRSATIRRSRTPITPTCATVTAPSKGW